MQHCRSVLFGLSGDIGEYPDACITHVSEDALAAAINYVDIIMLSTPAYMTGRGNITKEIATYGTGIQYTYVQLTYRRLFIIGKDEN